MSKFKIHKKFEINQPEKKKFEIQNQPEPSWFKQENSNDCGPCLVLNSLNALGIPHTERSIDEVRSRVNEIREEEHRALLQPNGWFNSFDVGEYLSRQGLSVAEYSCSPAEKESILGSLRAIFDNREFDLIYTTSGSHFRAIVRGEGGLLTLLDSFGSSPQALNETDAWNIIENTINSSNASRVEKLGVVRRGGSGYIHM